MCHNNSNNNNHDNVYGAIIMTKVIARVHTVYLANVDRAPADRQPSDQASRLGDNHNRLQCDSNLGPLTPQSDALTTRLLRPSVYEYTAASDMSID